MTNQPTMEMRQILNLSIPEPSDDGTAVIEGRAVPYGAPAQIGGITEVFAKGAADPKALRGKPILWQHDRAEVIGVVEGARNEDDGLYFRAKLIPTDRGRDAQIALRAGAVSGLSIGFMPVADRVDGDTITRTKVDIAEVSVATIPAYSGAGITSIREREEEGNTVDTPTVEATVREIPTADLATRDDLTALEARLSALATPAAAPQDMAFREALLQQITQSDNGQLRALADVVSSGNAGVLPPDWSREVRDNLDSQRYAFQVLGRCNFPSSGYTLTVPKVLQHVVVSARGTEKTEVASQAFTTGSDVFSVKWWAGAVDLALELILQSDPAIYPLVVDSLYSAYAITTDLDATASVEAAATHTGAAWDLTDWGTASADLIDNAEVIRAATGVFGDRVMATTADWKALIGLMDSDGRRIFATGGATNSDGTANLVSRSIDVGGILVSHNPRSTTTVQTNTKSARLAEKPPMQLTSDNVALMGRDVGILGSTMFADFYPAGILSYEIA